LTDCPVGMGMGRSNTRRATNGTKRNATQHTTRQATQRKHQKTHPRHVPHLLAFRAVSRHAVNHTPHSAPPLALAPRTSLPRRAACQIESKSQGTHRHHARASHPISKHEPDSRARGETNASVAADIVLAVGVWVKEGDVGGLHLRAFALLAVHGHQVPIVIESARRPATSSSLVIPRAFPREHSSAFPSRSQPHSRLSSPHAPHATRTHNLPRMFLNEWILAPYGVGVADGSSKIAAFACALLLLSLGGTWNGGRRGT
jgi:hypothetical protein